MNSKHLNMPPRVNRFLSQNWLARIEDIQRLDQSLKFMLHDPLKQHCWAAGIEKRRLTILTDSGAWATQLRYQQQQILKGINTDLGLNLNKLRIRVSTRSPAPPKPLSKRHLSKKSAAYITQGAQSIKDQALRETLLRLAKKAR
jgi:hypothetical protein